MKKHSVKFFIAIAICFSCTQSCKKDTPNDPDPITINISGKWTGNLLMDGNGNEKNSDSSYIFQVTQNKETLAADLTIPPEFGISNPVHLTGKLSSNITFSMQGTSSSKTIAVKGTIENKNAIQLVLEGVENTTQLVFVSKKDSLSQISINNTYKLNLLIGNPGEGRSVILIHGMDDNAQTWNTMIDYFKHNGLIQNEKAFGKLNVNKGEIKTNVVFPVYSAENPSIKGTATADVIPFGNVDDNSLIIVKSTTIPNVNYFKIGNLIAPLNQPISMLMMKNSVVEIALLNCTNGMGNVWTFEYKWWEHIKDNGDELLNRIQAAQANGKITPNPIIVAHSMGGLVSRSYIAQGGDIYRLVTLGTPHLGSNLSHFCPLGSFTGVGDLKPGSDFLKDLNSNITEKTERSKYWLISGRAGTYPSCYVASVPTCYKWYDPEPTTVEKAGYASLDKPNDGMVPHWSSKFSGNGQYEGDSNVNLVNTFEWVDHKNLNQDCNICRWVTNFVMNHQ